jgi:hypothetical protein
MGRWNRKHAEGTRKQRVAGTRNVAGAAALIGVTLSPVAARADEPLAEPPCPPGAFCTPPEPEPSNPTPPDVGGAVTVVLPPATEHARTVIVRQRPGAAPEIVSYEATGDAIGSKKGSRSQHTDDEHESANGDTTWGLQLRGTGVMLPELRAGVSDAAMGGAGMSLRYRPVSPLAIDVGLDVLLGVDSNGFQRREVPLSMSMLLYLLPDTVVQPYAFFGMSLTQAQVEASHFEPTLSRGLSDTYGYVGGHAGLGIDLRVASELSLSFDGLGFVRERVDSQAEAHPEFFDPKTGQASNTTVAGQLRGGVTFWW